MALVDARDGDYTVSFIRKSVVKATGPIPEPYVLTLSNLDLLSGRFPVTYFYMYHKAKHNDSSASIAHELRKSLANCLSHFHPFAGRIIPNPDTNEPEIVCDNTGALFLEAQASNSLKELHLYNLNKCMEGKLVPTNQEFPVQVQLTNYKCGGIFITFTFDHALGDASSFSKFLLMWSQIARKKSLSFLPDHRRNLLRARNPPIYNPSFDESFVSCSLHDIHNISTPKTLLKRLYYIDASSIDRLQKITSIDGTKRTKIEAFSAYIWKIMVKAIDKGHKKCKMGWLVDGRTRICNYNEKVTENYIGNALSIAVGEASVNEIDQASISDVAMKVHNAISKVTSAEHFLDLIDWIECHKPGLMLSKIVLGQGGPAIVVSSGRRFPVAEVNFGFGSPVLGTVYSTIKKLGVGYINQRQSAKGDGSWTVSAILWPDMIEALESDFNHVFQPMTSNHLKL
ncbi:coniferyl alcohol acyltransferase [Solanum dulcamara]|uniref:coniferyl alcohol acyltransferase n=1 Tax=Solanum dulcamara TaxID=45834 RepID=UPI002485A8CE|nr:coniferyl alcohol acyltransferase [Solanum dulcamara]XP_055825333.1 coniferyl alcohol acyltransferase [Solanum dulcamara]XP_055825334.1 coniferyl alcohol acyltransferase [Solanum dulcamara]XP_055825335.1 coniferyl alcohol acyltransferase [Solanum dulcamara]XP_055825336.1 coniferyl alcohol acyltransferase [Solanum dulcamara]XP_055825337.1 coniferyl alcohol acyltransferase [Solanum dulcamara]XP_055825338.1 coniferyl alcohol acyltransferase [Solanum dulcamara]